MSVYRTPDECFRDLPGYAFEPHYLEQDGLRMHYLDEGSGDPVLLLHGEPTWSFLYRKAIPPIAAVARVVAPDYFGFGRSDKPVERDWYTYDRHYASIERLVDELDLQALTVVVHDWGGPIGLRLAAERPERVARLVITNTGLYAGRPPSDEWLRFRAFVRRVGTELRPGQLVQITCVTELSDEVVAGYDAPYPVPEAKTALVMFPELVPTEPGAPLGADDAPSARGSPRLAQAGARALQRLRPHLLAAGRRALRGADPRCGARRAARRRGALPPGGQGRGARDANRRLAR